MVTIKNVFFIAAYLCEFTTVFRYWNLPGHISMLQDMSRVDGIIWRCIHLHKIVRLLLKSVSQNLCDICWVKSMDHEDKILWWHSKEIEFFFSLTFSCTIKQHIQQYLKTLLSVFCIFRWEFFGKTTFKLKLKLRFYCRTYNIYLYVKNE